MIFHVTIVMVFRDFPDNLAFPHGGLFKVTSEKGQQEKGNGVLRC